MPKRPLSPPKLVHAEERRVAAGLFNWVWTLIEREDRTAADDLSMIHCAHASAYHWSRIGGRQEAARGEWLISHVYAILGHGTEAVFHAELVLQICTDADIGDWDLAFAYEALARATAAAGDFEASARWIEECRAATQNVAKQEDRDLVLADLATVPTA